METCKRALSAYCTISPVNSNYVKKSKQQHMCRSSTPQKSVTQSRTVPSKKVLDSSLQIHTESWDEDLLAKIKLKDISADEAGVN